MAAKLVRTYDEVSGGWRHMHALPLSAADAAARCAGVGRHPVTPLPLPLPLPQEMGFIEQLSPYHYRVNTGFVPGMSVPGVFYVNDRLKGLLFEELQAFCQRGEHGGFLPAVKQIANVAALPGIVKVRRQRRCTCLALPLMPSSPAPLTSPSARPALSQTQSRSRSRCPMCTAATALLLATSLRST